MGMPGLAQVQKEATLDKLAIQLREYAKLQSNEVEILAMDSEVWRVQREHMRLLTAQAEMKAGLTLVGLERDIINERKAAEDSKKSEEQLAAELAEKRVILQKEQ